MAGFLLGALTYASHSTEGGTSMDAQRSVRRAFAALIAATAFVWACSQAPITEPVDVGGPEASTTELGELSDSDSGSHVRSLERGVPLAEPVRASGTIGPLGGTLALPEAGLTVVVPPGALEAPTTLTVIAPAGSSIGYHFFPEGQTFRAPLVVHQDLSGTDWAARLLAGGLVAAYFEGELRSTVSALELLPIDLFGSVGTFRIQHFSGYVIGTS